MPKKWAQNNPRRYIPKHCVDCFNFCYALFLLANLFGLFSRKPIVTTVVQPLIQQIRSIKTVMVRIVWDLEKLRAITGLRFVTTVSWKMCLSTSTHHISTFFVSIEICLIFDFSTLDISNKVVCPRLKEDGCVLCADKGPDAHPEVNCKSERSCVYFL